MVATIEGFHCGRLLSVTPRIYKIRGGGGGGGGRACQTRGLL